MGQHQQAIFLLEDLESKNIADADKLLNDFRIFQLADIYRASGDTAKAIECYQILANSKSENKIDYYGCSALVELATIFEKTNDYSIAIEYASKAYNTLQHLHHVALCVEVNHLLYKLHKVSGNSSLALMHFEKYHDAVLKMNRREVVLFANDYKRKMERIAISQDISRLREQNNKALMEKSNQKNLSIFLIVVASLLLIMLFTVRGFDTRLQLLADHVNAYSWMQKLLLLVLACLYFIGYFYFFIPIDKSDIVKNMSVLSRLWPGLIAGGVSLGTILLYNRIVAIRRPEMNWFVYSIYTSVITFSTVFLAEAAYFLFFGLSGVNFFLSLSLIVLASFILPLYLSIFIIENLFAKHFEAVSLSLTKNIDQFKQKVVPERRQITLNSEKTTSVLSFNVSDLLIAEAQGNYCKFYLKQGNTVVRKLFLITMKSTDEQLGTFRSIVRCHKSYLVNIHHVASVSGKSKGYFLHFDDDVEPVPISRSFQKDVLCVIDNFQGGIS
jgi:DNA-binding LytR/AlgR family response regulator